MNLTLDGKGNDYTKRVILDGDTNKCYRDPVLGDFIPTYNGQT